MLLAGFLRFNMASILGFCSKALETIDIMISLSA
jgi:hypothetical protein